MSDDMYTKIITTKPENKEGGILALLWRNILKDKGYLNNAVLYKLLGEYIQNNAKIAKLVGKVNLTNSEKGRAKSTVINNVTATDMTIKTWMDLIFGFLGIEEMTITITLKDKYGVVTKHTSPTIVNPRTKLLELSNEFKQDANNDTNNENK